MARMPNVSAMGTPVHRPVEFMKPIWSIVSSSPLISHWGWTDVAHMQLQLPEAAVTQSIGLSLNQHEHRCLLADEPMVYLSARGGRSATARLSGCQV